MAVAMAGSVLKASAAWQVGITSAIPIFHKVFQLLTQTEPDFSKLLDNVMIGPISLQPGDGGTYTIFSSYSARRKPFSPRYGPPPATIKSYSGKGWHACFSATATTGYQTRIFADAAKGWDLK